MANETGNPSGIPWDQVIQRTALKDRNWFAPQGSIDAAGNYERKLKHQGKVPSPEKMLKLLNARRMYLEAVTLSNGIRFAIIRDWETDEQTLDYHQYMGLMTCNCGTIHESPAVTSAYAITDTDLGDSYRLKMIVAGKSTGTPTSSAYVEKTVVIPNKEGQKGATHTLSFEADPLQRDFSARYEFKDGNEYLEARFSPKYVEPDRMKQILLDIDDESAEKRLVVKTASVDQGTSNQVNINFGLNGKLTSIALYQPQNPSIGSPVNYLVNAAYRDNRDWIVFRGKELHLPFVGDAARSMFGLITGKEFVGITLDAPQTLDRLIKNINQPDPKHPRELFEFPGSQRMTHWKPSFR